MNKVILIGNLARDPELTQTNSGVSRCTFTVAVNRNFSNAQGEREADFLNIVTWRNLAENCNKYLRKGRKVGIVGRIEVRSVEQDGVKKYYTDIIADDVEFLSPNDSGGASSGGDDRERSTPRKKVTELTPVEDDDLPF